MNTTMSSLLRRLLFPLLMSLSMFSLFSDTALAAKATNPKNPPKNAILLSKVESLTFRANKMTTARRVSPIPQLTCVGPSSVCALYPIDMMRCTNEGADYEAENIQWACRANLPDEFKLGSTEVMCEGYASSEDPFVLKGSCGVEYRLLLTDKGEEKYGRQDDDDSFWGGGDGSKQSFLARLVFFAIFGTVLFVIISRLLAACRRNPPRLGGGRGGGGPWFGGGGGHGDDGNDPPPPYDSHRFDPPRKTQRSYGTNSNASSSRQGGGQQQNQGWRPGPWTAGLAGAGLGYALGRNQGQRETQQTQRPGGGLFGGGGGSYRNPGPSRPAAPSGPSISTSRYESTGFGGTNRR